MFTKVIPSTKNSDTKRRNDSNYTPTLTCYLSNINHSLNRKKAEYISALCQDNETDLILLNETGVDPNKSLNHEIKGFKIIASAHKMHPNSF